MARVGKRALVKQIDPNEPIWKTKGDLLWGEYARTPAQDLVTTWIVLWHQRQLILDALRRLATTEQLTRSTLALKKQLETWFSGVEQLEWERGRDERFPCMAEIKIRETAVTLLQSVKDAEEALIATVRTGIIKGTPVLFRQLAGVLDLYQSFLKPPFAVDPVRYTIIEIAQQQRAERDAILREKPSSGLNEPPPEQLRLDINELQRHVKVVTGCTVAVPQLRRMCKELGMRPRLTKRGRRRKLR